MARTLPQIIDGLRGRGFDPRLQDISATYAFKVEGAGIWRVRVDHGKVIVRDGPGAADCTLTCSAEDFVRIAEGTQNLLTAYMQGRVLLEGDLGLAKLLHGLLPAAGQAPAWEGAHA